MIDIVIFMGCGYLVMQFGKPYQFAALRIVPPVLFGLLPGAGLLSVLFLSCITYAYTGFIYVLIDHFENEVVRPMMILIGGTVIWFGAGLVFFSEGS